MNPMNETRKTPVAYQLTAEALEMIERLSVKLGIPKQGVIELAVREYFEEQIAKQPVRARGK